MLINCSRFKKILVTQGFSKNICIANVQTTHGAITKNRSKIIVKMQISKETAPSFEQHF
jgi:hypothetical protein